VKNVLKAVGTIVGLLALTYIAGRACITERRGLETVGDTIADIAGWFREADGAAELIRHSNVEVRTKDHGGMSATRVDFDVAALDDVPIPATVDAVVVFLDRDGVEVHRVAFEYSMTARSAKAHWFGLVPVGVFNSTVATEVCATGVHAAPPP
jgi:hypothetical protein